MQQIISRRYNEYERNIEACVSVAVFIWWGDALICSKFTFQFYMFNLKLMHLERCKYITANGFFPLNFSTMFAVSHISYWAEGDAHCRKLRPLLTSRLTVRCLPTKNNGWSSQECSKYEYFTLLLMPIVVMTHTSFTQASFFTPGIQSGFLLF